MSAKKVKATQIAIDRLRLVYLQFGRRQAALQIAEGTIQDRMALAVDLERDELDGLAWGALEILDNAVDLGNEIVVDDVEGDWR